MENLAILQENAITEGEKMKICINDFLVMEKEIIEERGEEMGEERGEEMGEMEEMVVVDIEENIKNILAQFQEAKAEAEVEVHQDTRSIQATTREGFI